MKTSKLLLSSMLFIALISACSNEQENKKVDIVDSASIFFCHQHHHAKGPPGRRLPGDATRRCILRDLPIVPTTARRHCWVSGSRHAPPDH